ncbi:MAG: Crp/Fnr family transcriptional regulator [Clostridiaceae bacterium]|nr:Crp/Fnr family transcriptional regulator [Clostridiaceae bacterium]
MGVCVITKERFHSLLYTHPDIAISIIDELGKRISAMENAFQSMSVRNLDARIALLLLDYANRYGIMTKDGVKINLPISREGMANQLGIARETMSRKLSQLEKKGVILSENNRVLIIKKMDILDEMAGI